jgi:signal transduction histidine kinase/CheY-like chemotaxis protein
MADDRAAHRRTVFGEFQAQTVLTVAVVVAGAGLLYDFWITTGPERRTSGLTLFGAGSFAVALLTLVLLRVHVLAATLALGGGLILLIVAWAVQAPTHPVATLLGAVVVLLGALHGWRGALGGALAAGAALAYLAAGPAPAIGRPVAEVALALVVAAALLAWLSTRPIQLALDWSWSSYAQAREALELARTRQAELTRLNRSLAEAFDRIEQVNQELDRARRAAVHARRLRDRFAATVSHEMRTPLNIVVGFSEAMIKEPLAYYGEELPPGYRADVGAIYRSASHLSNLVDDILDLSQIEADQLVLHKEPTRVEQLVEEAVAVVAALFRARQLDLGVALPPDLPPVLVDRVRVRQILINLLSNAARFTHEGGIRITARAEEREVVFSVADTGAGIAAEHVERIFQEFGQAGSAPGGTRSTGLGLTISKRLAELHGGNMWVETEPGRGSTFSFSLPRTGNVAALPMRADWEPWAPAPTATAAQTVFALAEDPPARRILERHLHGYRVVALSGVEEVLDRAARQAPAAVLLVGSSPGRLHRRWERLRAGLDRPLICCQLRAPLGPHQELGIAAHLVKPVSRRDLARTLARVGRGARSCLVVDDDAEMVQLLARLTRALHPHWEVRTAGGGRSALRCMDGWTPDLILLDLLMPDLDGYAVLERVRADDRLRGTRVVIVSARGHEEEAMAVTQIDIAPAAGIGSGDLLRLLAGSLAVLTAPADDTPRSPTGAAAG